MVLDLQSKTILQTKPIKTFQIKILFDVAILNVFTTKKTKISEGYLARENVKSLSNSVTKFCDQGICEEFHFFRH